MRRVVWLALVVGCVALGVAAPAPARAAVEDEPPPVVGLTLDKAQSTLTQWWPSVQVEIVPDGLPGGADPTVLLVQSQKLRNPGWSDQPGPPDPVVDLALTAAVPDVIGRRLAEARAELALRGMTAGVTSTFDVDVVTSQDPKAGTLLPVAPSTVVSLEVAAPRRVPVPDVRDLAEDAACAALAAARLTCAVEVVRDGVRPGRAVDQDPPAGRVVPVGTAVGVTVERSTAPVESVRVPDLTGRTAPEAGAALDRLGLVARSVGDVTDGRAVGQDPAPGTPVAPGAVVTVRFEADAAVSVGLVAAGGGLLLLILALLAGALALRRARRARRPAAPHVQTTLRSPPPTVAIETATEAPRHTVGLRVRGAPATAVIEEVPR